jgi:purine-nucleoside phosphorylase
MKKIIQILFVCAILLSVSNAQTITHKALSSGAGKFDNASLHVTSSTGIVFGMSLSAGNLMLTQGFQQGVWKYFKDQDGDTYGNQDSAVYDFAQPLGYVLDSTDCNDFDSTIHNTMRIANIIGLDSLAIGSSFIYTDSTANGIWSLSSTTYASINAQGLLNALSAGLDTIKYTVQNGCGTFVATKPIQIIANPCLPSYVPTNGLVGWWPFCGNANDESGNGNNGLMINSPNFVNDRFSSSNSSLQFNGIDQRIDLPLNLGGALINLKTFSISCFVNSDTANGYYGIFSNWKAFPLTDPFGFSLITDDLKFRGGTNAGTGVYADSVNSIHNWKHVVAVFDGNNNNALTRIKIFVNGVLQKTDSMPVVYSNVSVSDNLGNSCTNTAFGAWMSQFGWVGFYKGKLDDIGIWNRTLTPAEIHSLYQSGQQCSVSHTTNVTICHRDSTLWNGKYYSRIGIDTVRLTSYQGCDSIDILNLNVHPFYYNVITQYFCQGDSIVFNGQSIKNAGTYFYHYTSITGCDSTVRLRALFYPKTVTKVNLNICTNDSVTYGGQTYTSAGVFAQHYTNHYGCDSIVQLTITKRVPNTTSISLYKCASDSVAYNGIYYKSAGLYSVHLSNKYGCDSLIKLTIVNRPNSFAQITRYCCVGDSVLYNSHYYKNAGTYTLRYSNKYGCDSIISLRVLNYPIAPTSLVKKYICQGSTLSFAGQNFTQSGKYIIHLQSKNGCDSVVQLAVYYNPVSISSVTIYRCSNDSVLYNSKYYSTNGVYTVRLTNKYGCDSIVNLQVLTRAISTNVVTYNKCKSDSVMYQGKYYNQPGTYIVRLQNYLNCDSLISLRILNYPNTVTYITRTICNGGVVMYNGTQYTSAGVYAQHAINRYGCDSIIQITITKNLSSYTNITKYKCPNDSVQVNGQYYSSNGVYTIRLTNYKQCDSIITLLVLTRPVSYSILTHYICQGDSTLYHGVYYKQTGTYFIHLTNRYGCDSTVRLRLLYNNSSSLTTVTLCQAQTYTWNGTTYTWGMAGTYVQKFINYKGCDSIATLKVYRGNCKLEGIAESSTITTTETFEESASPEAPIKNELVSTHNFEMSIYPNPNTGKFILENNCTSCKQMHVEIFTIDGKLMYSTDADNTSGKINIDVQLASGMYWVKMSNGNEGYSEMKKFVVNN